ncbi:MAG: hypothetical protein A3J50_03690 [Candidatus Woykebacteria bacterium RIFCSPHIGHO2_02_FULL_43_16b]|uniref:RNA polymerase sigma-70 region 4 domain-containing protein n=1 Tax=Candidatus Woykebacteria bacterium RIFCSPHIGHO2_02_FULL_43_16b TaxID=1802601 RepID=A0A1G1WN07_9BACT|nr:MAG: hypothetical protein A3J50_03690 [Candidatus Woykebacteria bacterium RIFCSPHIGHO2_02_FULL_43_16b]
MRVNFPTSPGTSLEALAECWEISFEEHQRVLRLLFNERGSAERVAELTGLTPKRVRELEKEALDLLHS